MGILFFFLLGFSVSLIILLFFSSVQIFLFFLRAKGLSKMMKTLSLKGRWMLYFPFFNNFAFGKLAEQYVNKNGKKSAKFSVILFIFGSISQMAIIFEMCITVWDVMFYGKENYIDKYSSYFTAAVVITIFVYLIFLIFEYIALWKIYAMFSPKDANLNLVMSIFYYRIMSSICLFAKRNNIPNDYVKNIDNDLEITNTPIEAVLEN